MTALISHMQCKLLYVGHGPDTLCNMKCSQFLQFVSSKLECPFHHFSYQLIDITTLSALFTDLRGDVVKTKRNTLLISGSHLEDQVTACTLEALMEGFDVHLLCDLIGARDIKLKPVLLVRLLQAGAVPSSLRQILFLWLAAETDQNMKAILHKLLESYDFTFAGRPR